MTEVHHMFKQRSTSAAVTAPSKAARQAVGLGIFGGDRGHFAEESVTAMTGKQRAPGFA